MSSMTTCPVHGAVRADEHGRCARCGMGNPDRYVGSAEWQLEKLYPAIEWRVPVKVSLMEDSDFDRYACRFCIAFDGLRGDEVHLLPPDRDEVERHIAEEHPSREGA